MPRSTFTDRVKKARADSGKTTERLAAESGLQRTTLHERMKSKPLNALFEWTKRFARALGVSPSWLVFGDENE